MYREILRGFILAEISASVTEMNCSNQPTESRRLSMTRTWSVCGEEEPAGENRWALLVPLDGFYAADGNYRYVRVMRVACSPSFLQVAATYTMRRMNYYSGNSGRTICNGLNHWRSSANPVE